MTDHEYQVVTLDELHEDPANARQHPEQNLTAIRASLEEWGQVEPLVVQKGTGKVIGGNARLRIMRDLGWEEAEVVEVDVDDVQATALGIALNRTGSLAEWEEDTLGQLLDSLHGEGLDVEGVLAYEDQELEDLLNRNGKGATLWDPDGGEDGALQERFVVPPFTVLDARQGYWGDRKRAWVELGIQSEVGREDDLVYAGGIRTRTDHMYSTGTSVFDPVLCEIAYRWFCPEDGHVLDPFAGGSVRGITAALLGRGYTGIDLREEQVVANRDQWAKIRSDAPATQTDPEDHRPEETPVEERDGYWFKRDDRYIVAGVPGGKARTCWAMAQGADGLITAGSRQSPQVNIVAQIAQELGVPCRVHVPQGDTTPELREAMVAGAELVQHEAGYNNVLISRATEDAEETGYRYIPFGMMCQDAVDQTREQVANLPAGAERLVVPVGSGMSLSGILWGLEDHNNPIPVLAVQVGKDPGGTLDEWAPPGWRNRVTLVESSLDYHDHAPQTTFKGVRLDPVYEAKCIPHLEPGDCLWVVGIRRSRAGEDVPHGEPRWITGDSTDVLPTLPEGSVDLVFTCPPYHDLEQYSDDPRDLSNADWDEFQEAYREIIAGAAARLKPHRFMVIVIGEARDPDGAYRGLVPLTVEAARDAGLAYYNEAVLVTPVGSLPIRTSHTFPDTRKLGKCHQNVLVFVKGDPQEAVGACGPVTVEDLGEGADNGA